MRNTECGVQNETLRNAQSDIGLKKVFELIEKKYEENKKREYIRQPLAYTLYKVWRYIEEIEVERNNEKRKETYQSPKSYHRRKISSQQR